MKEFLAALAGSILTLLALTAFGSFAFLAIAILYGISLYLLFFTQNTRVAWGFLAAITISLELLGTARFGSATLLGLLILFSQSFFAERLRFTSLYNRYILALLFAFILYALLLFPWSGLSERAISLGLLFIPLCFITYFLSSLSQQSEYELF